MRSYLQTLIVCSAAAAAVLAAPTVEARYAQCLFTGFWWTTHDIFNAVLV
jgi:hypothetical protein